MTVEHVRTVDSTYNAIARGFTSLRSSRAAGPWPVPQAGSGDVDGDQRLQRLAKLEIAETTDGFPVCQRDRDRLHVLNPAAFAEACTLLLAQPAQAQRLAAAGRGLAESRYAHAQGVRAIRGALAPAR